MHLRELLKGHGPLMDAQSAWGIAGGFVGGLAWALILGVSYRRRRRHESVVMLPLEGTNTVVTSADFPDEALDKMATALMEPVRTCRHCGCTDEHACPGGCYWIAPDVCSSNACVDKHIEEGDEHEEAGIG